jgi:hypothetical protein
VECLCEGRLLRWRWVEVAASALSLRDREPCEKNWIAPCGQLRRSSVAWAVFVGVQEFVIGLHCWWCGSLATLQACFEVHSRERKDLRWLTGHEYLPVSMMHLLSSCLNRPCGYACRVHDLLGIRESLRPNVTATVSRCHMKDSFYSSVTLKVCPSCWTYILSRMSASSSSWPSPHTAFNLTWNDIVHVRVAGLGQ